MSDGPAQVLEALRTAAGNACSGAAISAQLGVSRSQIWKHIEALRRCGYGIDGAAGDGYRLRSIPDRLYPAEIRAGLETRWLGREIHYYDSIDSTNRAALELGRAGAVHGTTVIAEGQRAGRGRLGRSFYSPPHLNLYSSTVLRPALTTAEAPTLILAAAVGVADSIAECVGDEEAVEIKWPNDVLLGGLKTSGISMEMSAEATRIEFAVLGIGVNLNVDRETFPREFRDSATSLRSHCGRQIDRIRFTRRLYRILEDVIDAHAEGGFTELRPRFEARFRMTGKRVSVIEAGDSQRTGVVLGVGANGALRIEQDDGRVAEVIAGDVSLAKDVGPPPGRNDGLTVRREGSAP